MIQPSLTGLVPFVKLSQHWLRQSAPKRAGLRSYVPSGLIQETQHYEPSFGTRFIAQDAVVMP